MEVLFWVFLGPKPSQLVMSWNKGLSCFNRVELFIKKKRIVKIHRETKSFGRTFVL